MLLQYKYKVKQVIVCQILHRLPPKRPIKYEIDVYWINGRCDELNVYLDSYFKDDNMEDVMFWRHSGFWSPDSKAPTYIDDEVNLNNQDGYLTYYRNVRAAVVTVRKKHVVSYVEVCCNCGLQYFNNKQTNNQKHVPLYICLLIADSHLTKNLGFEIDMLYNYFGYGILTVTLS